MRKAVREQCGEATVAREVSHRLSFGAAPSENVLSRQYVHCRDRYDEYLCRPIPQHETCRWVNGMVRFHVGRSATEIAPGRCVYSHSGVELTKLFRRLLKALVRSGSRQSSPSSNSPHDGSVDGTPSWCWRTTGRATLRSVRHQTYDCIPANFTATWNRSTSVPDGPTPIAIAAPRPSMSLMWVARSTSMGISAPGICPGKT